jgi:tetratricopeptide (TPR) repeat protein
MNFLIRLTILLAVSSVISLSTYSQKRSTQRGKSATTSPSISTTSAGSLTIRTEPNAIVWVDEIRRGVSDTTGALTLTKISSGRHTMRVRAIGFKEASLPLLPGRGKQLTVKLVRTSDEAELKFQQAEEAREKAKDEDARRQAVDLYREALKLRPSFPTAHVGLARSFLDLNEGQNALSEIEAARRTRPSYAEASAVEGRVYREMAFTDEATKSFQRAIREGNGFQPEAHVGLARLYEDSGRYEAAAAEYQLALKQLSDSEPVIYQLLGATYEKLEKYKEALAAYEKYLQLAPNGNLAPAVRSIIDQVRRDAAGRDIVP